MPIKALLFDLDGTIIDTEKVWDEAAIEFLRRRGHTYDPTAVKHLMMGGTMEQGAVILRDHHGFTGDPVALAAERRQIFADLLEHEVTFIPGFTAFYQRVKIGYPIAIATSMERAFLAKIEHHLHLSEYFGEHIYSIADIGFIPKPHPDIFLYAAQQLGTNPADCLVIEDAPKGVQAARAAGMRCAALTTSTTRERLATAGADQVVDRYDQITL